MVSGFDPALALRLNPLRSDDRIEIALDKIGEPRSRKLVEVGLFLSPIDARFYSLLGVFAEQDGDRRTASNFYRHSLRLLPTELQALSRELAFDIEAERYISASEKLEILGRRWPDRWNQIEPILPILLSDSVAYEWLMRRFGDNTRLRSQLIRSIAREAETLPFAYRLVVDWFGRNEPDLDSAINLVTAAYLHNKQYAEAYLLFQLTRPEDARSGFVYNESFSMPFSGNPFDWRIQEQPGVSFDRITRNGKTALSLKFLDNPIQFQNLGQYVRLVPGPYVLKVSYEAQELAMPEPIRLAMRCLPSDSLVLSEPFKEGTGDHNESFSIIVPATDCALQEIFLYNDKLPLSWRNRYRGMLMLKSVSIRRTEAM